MRGVRRRWVCRCPLGVLSDDIPGVAIQLEYVVQVFFSWCFAVSELQYVSTLSQSVRMQDVLCPMGWLLSEASILSVVVDFLYTLVASRPDSSRVTKTSKNAIGLFCSNSLVNCMPWKSEFN